MHVGIRAPGIGLRTDLQSMSSKSTEIGSRYAPSKDKNATGSYSSFKPVSLNLKQESLSLQSNRLLLGSKLTPLTSSLLSTSKTSSLQGGSYKTTLSTKSPLINQSTSLGSSSLKKPTVTNTLIKPSQQRQVKPAGFQQPSHLPKKAVAENRQVLIDETVGNFEIPDYDFHFDVKERDDQFWGQDDETSFETVNPELLSLMISSEDINSKKVNLRRKLQVSIFFFTCLNLISRTDHAENSIMFSFLFMLISQTFVYFYLITNVANTNLNIHNLIFTPTKVINIICQEALLHDVFLVH